METHPIMGSLSTINEHLTTSSVLIAALMEQVPAVIEDLSAEIKAQRAELDAKYLELMAKEAALCEKDACIAHLTAERAAMLEECQGLRLLATQNQTQGCETGAKAPSPLATQNQKKKPLWKRVLML